MDRAHSVLSSSTGILSSNGIDPPLAKLITRRRLSPTQAAALNKMFQAKSHPLKEERIALATEIGMDLKAVTIWFQNKRQITKRHSHPAKENIPPDHEQGPKHKVRSTKSALARFAGGRTSSFRATISLDCIAERCERISQHTPPSSRYPVSPVAHRNRPPSSSLNKSELWKLMPSSPIAPPSSPSTDSARFNILPSRSETLRSLEWACARARINSKPGEDAEPTAVSPPGTPDADLSDGTATEVEEAITPDSSVDYSLVNPHGSVCTIKGEDNKDFVDGNASPEVEAAMVLLGFKAQL